MSPSLEELVAVDEKLHGPASWWKELRVVVYGAGIIACLFLLSFVRF